MDDQDTCLTEPLLAQCAGPVSRCTLSQVVEESDFHAFSTTVLEHLWQAIVQLWVPLPACNVLSDNF